MAFGSRAVGFGSHAPARGPSRESSAIDSLFTTSANRAAFGETAVRAPEDAMEETTPDARGRASPSPEQSLLCLLPDDVSQTVQHCLAQRTGTGVSAILSDIVVDDGRLMRLRFCGSDGDNEREEEVCTSLSVEEALAKLQAAHAEDSPESAADLFLARTRVGVSGTLHRISAMKDSRGEVYGLTYRIGRHIEGAAEPLLDVVATLAQGIKQQVASSLLIVGPPGVGKTCLLRDITRMLADEHDKLVMVVDTSQEIAGGGLTPHACIGRARRILGGHQQSKHEVLQEAVANHGPEVVVVDEIGSAKEVAAMRDIAHRGVSMVASAHGTSLQHLLENPVLNSLVGSRHRMLIGDMAASLYDGRKTKQERCECPTFSMLVEVVGHNEYAVHKDVAASVDAILQGRKPAVQHRSS